MNVITLQFQHGRDILPIKMRKGSSISSAMKAYCDRHGCNMDYILFRVQRTNQYITLLDTPLSLQLRENEKIIVEY
jgi:hypothetical protein